MIDDGLTEAMIFGKKKTPKSISVAVTCFFRSSFCHCFQYPSTPRPPPLSSDRNAPRYLFVCRESLLQIPSSLPPVSCPFTAPSTFHFSGAAHARRAAAPPGEKWTAPAGGWAAAAGVGGPWAAAARGGKGAMGRLSSPTAMRRTNPCTKSSERPVDMRGGGVGGPQFSRSIGALVYGCGDRIGLGLHTPRPLPHLRVRSHKPPPPPPTGDARRRGIVC